MTQPFTLTEGSPEWHKIRHKCQTDLFFLAADVLGYGELVPMRKAVHGALCRLLTRTTGEPAIDDCPYLKIEMPRGTGKTSVGTICRPIQLLLKDPNTSILICNEREQNAKDILSEISSIFETNELLRALFPEICPDERKEDTWSGTRINVKRQTNRKEPSIFIIGLNGTVTGMHPDHIFVDDILSREAMENSRVGGGQMMQQINRWLHQLKPLLNYQCQPFPEIVFIGTRWWFGDSYEHIEEWLGYGFDPIIYQLRTKLDDGTWQSVPVRKMGDLVCFTRSAIEDGRSIFPEKWDLEALAKMRMEDQVLFAANYMNKPTDDLTSIFKPSWINRYDWPNDKTIQFVDAQGKKTVVLLNDLDKTIYFDPGGFGKQGKGGDRARAAMVLVGTWQGMYAILDVYSEKETFLGAIRKLVEWISRYRPRKLRIEEVAQQAGFIELVRRELVAQNAVVTMDPVKPGNKDKDQRILQLEPYFQRGSVFLGRGAQFHDLLTQLEQFPRNTRKDLLDALAYAVQDWARLSGRQIRPSERQANERAAFLARRGA